MNRRSMLKSGGAAMFLPLAPWLAEGAAAQSYEITLNSNLASVGNSLTDQTVDIVHYFMTDYGRGQGALTAQSIPGASMQWNWDHAHEAPIDALAALRAGRQDVFLGVESVPFRHVQTPGDVCSITAWKEWYDAAIEGGVTRFFVLEAWHDLQSGTPGYDPEDKGDPDIHIPWRERIDFARQFYLKIVDYVNERRAPGQPQANMIPGGTFLARIHDDIAAGAAPDSLTRIEDVFSDSIHPNIKGRYALACLIYACIFRRSPVGMPVLTADIHGRWLPRVPPREAAYFQALAWEVAQENPYAGIAT